MAGLPKKTFVLTARIRPMKQKQIFRRFETPDAFKEFLSETGEWHALWLGFYSSFYSLKTEELPDYLKKDVQNEYHYYTFGHFLGRITQAVMAIIAAKYGINIRI